MSSNRDNRSASQIARAILDPDAVREKEKRILLEDVKNLVTEIQILEKFYKKKEGGSGLFSGIFSKKKYLPTISELLKSFKEEEEKLNRNLSDSQVHENNQQKKQQLIVHIIL